MKKSLLSVILLIIAWAVSATAVTTPRSAIVRLEDTLCNRYYDENICCRSSVRRTLIHLIAGDTGVYGGVSGTNKPQNVSVRTRIPAAWNRRTAARHISPHPDRALLREAAVYPATRLIDVFQTPSVHYPYGEPTIEPTGQRYLFGGKEREHAGGRNSYDYGPRNLGSSANWDSQDKLATETPQISPFSYCGGDPINRIDPTGMIGYVINEYGELQELVEDDELDYIDIAASDGRYISGDRFPSGTIESYKQFSGGVDVYRIRGDENGKKIFEFLADNTKIPNPKNTDKTTGVEFSLFQTGIEGDKSLNFISTSHREKNDFSGGLLLQNQLQFGYTIRAWAHNHPSGSLFSSDGDLNTAEVLSMSDFLRNITLSIYYKKGTYRLYDKYDILNRKRLETFFPR